MHVSAKSDYALRALVHLADLYRGDNMPPVSIRLLAERNDIPKRFLEQIMIELRACGWVKSVAGRDGGFVLAVSPHDITMGQIIRHFEGSLAPIGCVSSANHQPCSQQQFCRFRRVFQDIRSITAAILDRATLAAVVSGQAVTLKELMIEEFYGSKGI
jgi:Rrf2 family protein